jgi:hypothetical protein
MKPVLIVENSTSNLVRESKSAGKEDYVLNGTFTEFDKVNRNERIYTADKFLPALNELNERMESLGAVYGEFDHPDVFDTSLSRASHIITKANYIKERNAVEGEIKLLSTYWGKEAKSLVNDGCPVFVSSRAAGITESDGSVSLKKLFTYDIVADPGFASAKMDLVSLNESLGYNEKKSNFRIYEMSDESKINELVNMNKNEFVTKNQMTDYSSYLVNELAQTKKLVKSAISKGDLTPKKLEELMEFYEELNKQNEQVVKYLDYMAEKVQVVVKENKDLRSTTSRLVEHNDYLAENLEKAINYSEYIAENLDKNIAYSEYIAENLDKNIAYSEYIAENLDKNIAYSEYIAENLDGSIKYSEYLAEHVEGNIKYSEYIAENLDNTIEYGEYVAENLDKALNYQSMIVEKLNENNKLFESSEEGEEVEFPSLEDAGFEKLEDEDFDTEISDEDAFDGDEEEVEETEVIESTETEVSDEEDEEEIEESVDTEESEEDEEEIEEKEFKGDDDSELSKSIDKLIEEAKRRKVSETTDLNFLKFLSKSQVDSFYALTEDEQETVKLHINERGYFTQKDVLSLITEALSEKTESVEERIIRLMPDNIKPIWENLADSSKKSILSQARLYPEEVLTTESQVEHFWSTRKINNPESTKKLVSRENIVNEDRLTDEETNLIMERFKNL